MTTFALDVQGLPEVISTGAGNAYLHLPGVIVAENGAGERRFLLPDGLGSVRQATDETGMVAAYHAFDPYGNPVADGGEPYSYTGEWWEEEVGLLYLRARWYRPETGSFLSRDPVESEPPYLYAQGNPINLVDPLGLLPPQPQQPLSIELILHRTFLQNVVEAFRWAYSRNGIVDCANTPDDGQHPSDDVAEVFVDFVCEYGPNPRYFDGNDQLTIELAASHVMADLRDEFYRSPPWEQGIKGSVSFVGTPLLWATVDAMEVGKLVPPPPRSVTHFLGGFSYEIKKVGIVAKFHVENTTSRQSGSRLRPGSGSGDSIEEALARGEDPFEIIQKLARGDIVAALKSQTREETTDAAGMGGGDFKQIFDWDELFDECRDTLPQYLIPVFPRFRPRIPLPIQLG